MPVPPVRFPVQGPARRKHTVGSGAGRSANGAVSPEEGQGPPRDRTTHRYNCAIGYIPIRDRWLHAKKCIKDRKAINEVGGLENGFYV